MSLSQKVVSFLKMRPLVSSLVGNTLKTVGADILTQTMIEKKEDLDLKRLALFTTFGCAYLGGWQYFIFNKCFVFVQSAMTTRRISTLSQASALTFLDMGVHTPLMYYPSFYMMKGVLEDKTPTESLMEYRNNFSSDMTSICKVWIPAQMINFTLVPLYLRMPYITGVSFAWTVLLSMMRGDNTKKK